ncbi:MAG: hypothetical protein AB7H80_01935 [Candidatus Kapaibacterium sp.]
MLRFPGALAPGHTAVAPAGAVGAMDFLLMADWCCRQSFMNITMFTREARIYRAAPEGSDAAWPWGKP